jgi:hypothetical protein
MQVNATILVNGRPLAQAFVEHIVAGVGTTIYMTNSEGQIRSDSFDSGIESFTSNADIRILCQNPVVRVVDGGLANIAVYQDKAIVDGDVINLNSNAEQRHHYNVLDRAWRAYQVVYQSLSFFQDLPKPDFPLGRGADLRITKDQARRIELSFPDNFPSPLAFVEPKRLIDDFPLMHIKDRASDGRLFGETDAISPNVPQRPTLIPGELAHALHFSHLSTSQRGKAQDKYIEFIASELFAARAGTHAFNQRTSAIVAFIEALDHYGARFSEFMRARQGNTSTIVNVEPVTAAIQQEFVEAEWFRLTRSTLLLAFPQFGCDLSFPPPTPLPVPTTPLQRFARTTGLSRRFLRSPCVTGGDVEGAVYAAIFVDFALSVGLDFAASSYFRANALTFGEYRSFINDRHPDKAGALERARSFWGL